MGKRFGRNQRRRAREALAAAQAEASKWHAGWALNEELVRHQGLTLRQLRSELEDAREIVGRASLAFPVSERLDTQMDTTEALRYGINLAPMPTMTPARFGSMEVSIKEMQWRATHLDVLLPTVRLEDFSQRVHFRVHFADEQVGYAMSSKDVYLMSHRQLIDRIHHEIAPKLAHHLTNLLKPKETNYGRSR